MRFRFPALACFALVSCSTAQSSPGRGPVAESVSPAAAGPAEDERAPARSPSAPPKPDATVAKITANGDVRIGSSAIDVRISGNEGVVDSKQISAWVAESATDVADYFGRFPVPELAVTIQASGRGRVGFGQHWDGRYVKVRVGSRADEETLAQDWTMVHEMLHACFPDLERRHKWMQEGLSTYLQRIVQARRGRYPHDKVWSRFMEAMEHGRPKAGDRGLDQTRTWGRLYWGGALFWFVVDVEIRRATHNEKSLRDALIGIVDAGGDGRVHWSTERVVKVGDAAAGTTVLRDVYDRMAKAPGDVDLDALWSELGVTLGPEGNVVYDDSAPLAHVRKAMLQ